MISKNSLFFWGLTFFVLRVPVCAQDKAFPPSATPPAEQATGTPSYPSPADLQAAGLQPVSQVEVEPATPPTLPKPEWAKNDVAYSSGVTAIYWSPHRKYSVSLGSSNDERGHLNDSSATYYKGKEALWSSGDWDGFTDYCPEFGRNAVFFEKSGEVLIDEKFLISRTGKPIFLAAQALFNDDYSKAAYLHDNYSAISFLDLKTGKETKALANFGTRLLAMSQKGDFVLVYQDKTGRLERINWDGTTAWSLPKEQFGYDRSSSNFLSIVNNGSQLVFCSWKDRAVSYFDALTGKACFQVTLPRLFFENDPPKSYMQVGVTYDGNLLVAASWGMVDPQEAATPVVVPTPTPQSMPVLDGRHKVARAITRDQQGGDEKIPCPEILVFNLEGKILWHQRLVNLPFATPYIKWLSSSQFYLTDIYASSVMASFSIKTPQ